MGNFQRDCFNFLIIKIDLNIYPIVCSINMSTEEKPKTIYYFDKDPGYVNKFNSLSSVSLLNKPAVSDIVSLIGALTLISWVSTLVSVVESTNKSTDPHVPNGAPVGENDVYVT